ncbi:MAG: helix-turn-helix domain-containing protein [Carbonactinosporaceae bacterium]
MDLGAALAIVRNSAGLTQLEMATLLGWEQSAVARVEGGTRDTLYDVRKLLVAVDALDMPREALTPLLLGKPDATIEHTEDEMDIDRRQFHGILFGLVAGAGFDRVQIPRRVDVAHVRYLRATVDRLYQQDQQVGGAALARSALRQYHRARRMLDEADYSTGVGADLMKAAGDLAVCVGWLAFDAGDRNLSRHLYSEALLLAGEAGDDALSVRVMEKMALQSVYVAREGRVTVAREAIRLSERAADLARRDPTPRLHALIAAREAIGHAMLGETRSFNAAITRAWREIDRSGDDDPVWLQFVTPAEIHVHEGMGRTHLKDHATAAELYRDSLTADLPPRNAANYRSLLAATLASEGDATEAVREGMAVLPTLEGRVVSPRTLQDLQPVRIAAEQTGAEEFCIRYDKLARQIESLTA